MPDTPSITIAKTGFYRGVAEEYSNTYHFTGTTPADGAAWKTLGEAIWASEKTFHPTNCNLTKIYGYNAGDEHSVFQKDYVADGTTLIPGTLGVVAGDTLMAGDQAIYLRALRAGLSNGKKVYCGKYFHFGLLNPGSADAVNASMKTKIAAHATLILGGTLAGGFTWSGPQAQALSNPVVKPFVTTRTLKRRGKRPSRAA